MPNELNETTILDNQTLNFGTSKDFKMKYDSVDNRWEILDSSDAVIAHLSTAGALTVAGALTGSDDVVVSKLLKLAPSTATIASGAITATSSYMIIDTEGAAATDDLDTINGGEDGARLVLMSANTSRKPTIKNNTGNIRCGADFEIANTSDTIELIFRAGSGWKKISSASN